MHHNLAIESLNYYNKIQAHSSTHTNVLKSTKIKLYTYYMAFLNSQQAPVRPLHGTGQTGATQTAAQTTQICVFNPESSPPLSSSIQEGLGGEAAADHCP
jgi:hypothetical protein